MGLFNISKSDIIIFSDVNKQVCSTLYTMNEEDQELYQEAKLELFNYKDEQEKLQFEIEMNGNQPTDIEMAKPMTKPVVF